MVKANAYNHGIDGVTYIAKNIVDRFGVATIDEARQLREMGIKTPISLFGCHDVDLDKVKEYSVTPVAYNLNLFKNILEKGISEFDIKIDSGMHRFGFNDEKDIFHIVKICKEYGVKPRAVHTHFMSPLMMNSQISSYNRIIKPISDYCSFKHILSASSGIDHGYYFDGVRIGLKAYKNALEITSVVLEVKDVRKGEQVGYDGDYCALNNTRIAIVGGGYYDGIRRSYKGAFVKINEQLFNIVGKVSMDTFFVDVGYHQVNIGDKVIVLSNDTLNSFIGVANTNEYEVLVSINGRGKRIYEFNGKAVSSFIN